MAGIFISYRQEDAKPWALLLCKELAEVFGEERVFLDKDTLRAGDWRVQIQEALSQARVVLVVIGRRWLTVTDETGLRRLDRSDDVHRHEIASALARKEVMVIPVLVDGVAMPRAEDLPLDIRSLSDQQSRELSDGGARRAVDMRLLVRDIRGTTGFEIKRNEARLEGSPKIEALKSSLRTFAAVIALSAAVWVFFYRFHPAEPLMGGDLTVVVVACALVVFSVKGIWAHLHRRKEER